MTRDAKTTQSVAVEKCYSHDWKVESDERSNPIISCSRCAAFPKAKEAEQAEAIVNLKQLIKPGDTIYTTLRHVSRSGMQRVIDLNVIIDNEPRWIGYTAAKALGDRYDDRQGIVTDGAGMDMGFHLVYNLSRTLFPSGFGCTGEGCRSNDHSNGDRDYTPHVNHATSPDHICAREPKSCTAKKHWHNDGGYALQQRWL
jgi:hypothetical protein